jgi:hypothetical protein
VEHCNSHAQQCSEGTSIHNHCHHHFADGSGFERNACTAARLAGSLSQRRPFFQGSHPRDSAGYPKGPIATINRLIEVLDNQDLAAAISRLEKGYGLRLVK